MYIVLDTETGGLGEDVSLLTAYFGIYNESFELVDELDLAIKPKDKIYHVTGQALEVNKINLIDHDKVAILESDAGTKLYNFIQKHSNKGQDKLIPVGHNVQFDIQKVCKTLISKPSWEVFCAYRILDTGVIAQFFKACGLMPIGITGSLGSLKDWYKVQGDDSLLHTAKEDARITFEVLKSMVNQLKENTK